MSWETTKIAGTDLVKSADWNAMVVDQKTKARTYIQATAPTGASNGDYWYDTTKGYLYMQITLGFTLVATGDFITNSTTTNLTGLFEGDGATVGVIPPSAPGAGLLSVVGIGNGESAFSEKAIFDTTNPANLGTAGPGAQVVASRRDHVHTLPKLDDLVAPDNNTDLNASTTAHGLEPKATAPVAGLRSVLAIDNEETARSDKALFDTTNPAPLGAAAPGTAMLVARRDHIHTMPTLDGVSAPSDNAVLDTSTTAHGLAPKAVSPTAGLLNLLGIANGETVITNKAIFDTTNPSMDGTAAPGTQIIAARRDHIHPSDTSLATSSHTHVETNVLADATEAQTWDATLTTLVNNLNRIRYMIVTITGETWGTVSHSIATLWGKFHETTGHKHTGIAGDAAQVDHGGLGGLTDDDHARYFDKDCSKALTGASITRSISTDEIDISGGNGYPNSFIVITGKDSLNPIGAGTIEFYVTDAAKSSWGGVMRIPGVTDTPYLDMLSHQIKSVTDPSTAQDAATRNYVDTTTFALNGSRALTGTDIYRNVNNSYLNILGGGYTEGSGANIALFGKDYTGIEGQLWIRVPNAAGTGFSYVCQITGKTDSPAIIWCGNRLQGVGDPLSAQDAATRNYVDTRTDILTIMIYGGD